MGEPHLSEYITASPLVFLSGQLALDGDQMVGGGIASQTKQCLDNVVRVLESLNLGLGNVVKTTVWLRNADDFPTFNTVYGNVFGSHRPARSTVVNDLVVPEALVEIEVVAFETSR